MTQVKRPFGVAIGKSLPVAGLAFLIALMLCVAGHFVEAATVQENNGTPTPEAQADSDNAEVADEQVTDEHADKQPDDEEPEQDESVVINIHLTDLTQLVGQEIDVRKSNGDFEGNLIVTEAKPGNLPESIMSLKVREEGTTKQHRISASRIEEIYINEYPLDVTYQRKDRSMFHDAEKRAARMAELDEISQRLAVNRDRVWVPLTPEQHEEFISAHCEFLKHVETTMPDLEFRLVETEYYLFFTDLAPEEVDGYIVYLDAMYEELCTAFGIPPTRNIWCGKCVVIAFRDQEHYLRFEKTIMEVDGTGSQGMCHSFSDGKVVFAGFKGDGGFGHVLVHETSHGFVHRYFSTARAPSWLNEGMADWLAHEIVKGDRIPQRRIASAKLIQRRNSWGNLLTTERINGEMYGAASTLVEILLREDEGGQFKQYFDDLKRGKDSEEALKDAFGISYNDLQILYAEAVSGR